MTDTPETNVVHEADALDRLGDLSENSAHAVVTDPPYGLAFMGRDWDDFEPREYQAWCEEWATEALRVLRPGGHLLAFSGNRTHHRLFSGVEDAGFEIRDTLTWHYGSGFPKALDVSKAIDDAKGAEREVIGEHPSPLATDGDTYGDYTNGDRPQVTAPATPESERWDGWRTTLKPATEFVVMARAPLEGTVAETVQEWGTGALNIDGCRIEHDGDKRTFQRVNIGNQSKQKYGNYQNDGTRADGTTSEGRYPANVVFDAAEAERLDRLKGEREAGDPRPERGEGGIWNESVGGVPCGPQYGDTGGPSRYFYTSKATRAERTLDGKIDNSHPTVKPADLTEWLVRLVTREGQVVLDPFAGTGTTLKAAKDLGREFIGIEQQARWADVARVRAGLSPDDPSHVRSDDAQQGLEAYGTDSVADD